MLKPRATLRHCLSLLLLHLSVLTAYDTSDFVTGTLDNGLSYIVAHCPLESGRAQMHLRMAVGGMDETEQERGYSHFLEHMAFEGSTQFPHGRFENRLHSPLNRNGIHSNAYTSLSETVYTLYLDELGTRNIETGLNFFVDIFDGLEFNPERVEHERAVILEEKREGESLEERYYSRIVDQAIFGQHLFGHRQVIGTDESLLAVTAGDLRTYHTELYCPSKACIVVVGDVDPKALAARIEEQLSPVERRATIRRRPRPTNLEQPASSVVIEPTASDVSYSLVQLDARYNWTLRHILIAELAASIMERRLEWALASGLCAFDDVKLDLESMGAGYTLTSLSVAAPSEKWQLAADQFTALLQDSYCHGISDEELDWACDALIDDYWEVGYPEGVEEYSVTLLHQVDLGQQAMEPELLFEEVQDLLDTVERKEVNAALRDLVHGPSTTLRVVSPHALAGLDVDALSQRINDPHHVLNIVSFYELMASERVEKWIDSVDWRGAISASLEERSMHRRQLFASDPLEVTLYFGLDSSANAAEQEAAIAMLGSYVRTLSPVLDALELQIDVSAGEGELVLTLMAERHREKDGFKLLRHILKQAQVDPILFAAWQQREVKARRQMEHYDLEYLSFQLLFEGLTQDAPISGLPAKAEALASVSAQRCNAALRDILEHAALAIFSQGPMREERMLKRLAKTFNGLLERRDFEEPETLELGSFRAASKTVIMGHYDERAALLLAYPLPEQATEEEAVVLDILDAYLTDAIRYHNPLVYSILLEPLELGEQRMLSIWTHCHADNIDRVTSLAQATLEKLGELGPSKKEIRAALENAGLDGEVSSQRISKLFKDIFNTKERALISIRTVAEDAPQAA